MLRAAELYGRAALAACTLGEDNLVVLNMRLHQSHMLSTYTTSAVATDPSFIVKARSEHITLLSSAVDALERRRVAGTLLEGKCAAVEEAWRASYLRHLGPTHCTADETNSHAALVGYSQFLHAATNTAWVLL